MKTPSSHAEERVTVLDGVRGLAILLVLYCHFILYSGLHPEVRLDWHLVRLGQSAWLGVDLFFVLSGFLITGILHDARGSPHYFRNFYGRRSLRIFPLYYFALAVAYLGLPFLMSAAAADALHGKQWWYWLYASNVDIALNGWHDPAHLGHFWSLAVEEQFYLVWPLVVFGLSRAGLIRVCILCIIGALALRFAMSHWLPPLASYVLMPTRMDAFAAGGLVAMLMRSPGGLDRLGAWPMRVLLACTATWIAGYFWKKHLSATDPLVSTVGFSIIAIGFAALIAVSLTSGHQSWLRRALSTRVLLTLGKYSYALYVFHHPIIHILRDHGFGVAALPKVLGSSLPGLLLFSGVAFAATFACALASWRLVETPFLRLKKYLPSAAAVPRGVLGKP